MATVVGLFVCLRRPPAHQTHRRSMGFELPLLLLPFGVMKPVRRRASGGSCGAERCQRALAKQRCASHARRRRRRAVGFFAFAFALAAHGRLAGLPARSLVGSLLKTHEGNFPQLLTCQQAAAGRRLPGSGCCCGGHQTLSCFARRESQPASERAEGV